MFISLCVFSRAKSRLSAFKEPYSIKYSTKDEIWGTLIETAVTFALPHGFQCLECLACPLEGELYEYGLYFNQNGTTAAKSVTQATYRGNSHVFTVVWWVHHMVDYMVWGEIPQIPLKDVCGFWPAAGEIFEIYIVCSHFLEWNPLIWMQWNIDVHYKPAPKLMLSYNFHVPPLTVTKALRMQSLQSSKRRDCVFVIAWLRAT